MKKLSSGKYAQIGQAMTEMVVASAFVVVPLFLIVSMLGKFIDMKHASVSAARYAAWERTVWHESNDSTFFGIKKDFLAKSKKDLEAEVERRVFVDASASLVEPPARGGRVLWTYHNSLPIYDRKGSPQDQIEVTDVSYDGPFGLGKVLRGLDKALQVVTKIVCLGGDCGFDVIDMGRGNTTTKIKLRAAPVATYRDLRGESEGLLDLGPTGKGLTFTAQAGLIHGAWEGLSERIEPRVKGLVPTSLLGEILDATKFGQNALAALTLSPELAEGQLIFGHIDTSVLPAGDVGDDDDCPWADPENLEKLLIGDGRFEVDLSMEIFEECMSQ